MAYLLISLGIGLVLWFLVRFFMYSHPNTLVRIIKIAGIIALGALILMFGFFAFAFLGILCFFIPFFFRSKLRQKRNSQASKSSFSHSIPPMTEQEAYKTLGLTMGATEKDVIDSYQRLIKKVDPNHPESPQIIQRLNAAKNFLLKKN